MRQLIAFLVAALLVSPAAPAADFSRDIYPVLQRACFECHGPEKQKGKLRLDQREAALKGGENGETIVTGKPEESELLRRVMLPRSDDDAMPSKGELLKPAEIAALKDWIAAGAVWPDKIETQKHWAYVKPRRVEPPRNDWSANPIDGFIFKKLGEEKLTPSPEAPPELIVRRMTLDLTGLPPTPAEVASFVAECRQGSSFVLRHSSLEKLADRLLASPEFGVRWARPWLDAARYADSHGFQRDDIRDIWAYRDWVVRALNADMPFDQFTLEQVAGDLLPQATQDQRIATGFHRCTPTNVEAGTEPEESRINQVLDRVNTTGAVWLGTTLECAQCHDHKFDPITQREYYQFVAFFNNTEQEAERANPKTPGSIAFRGPSMPLKDVADDRERARLTAEIAALDGKLKSSAKAGDAEFAAWSEHMAGELARPSAEQALEVVEFVSEGGAGHRVLDDKSVLLTGRAPATDTYRIVTRGGLKDLAAVKLEALIDDSLPGKGPGRGDAERSNFVLNTFTARVRAANANDDAGKPLKFVRARADFSQTKFDPAGAIDGDAKTAWAIGPEFHKPHWAVFELENAVDVPADTELVFELVQRYGTARTLGRVRLSAVTGSLAGSAIPEPIAAILRRPAARRTAAQVVKLREHFDRDRPALAGLTRARMEAQRKLAALPPPTTQVMRELAAPRLSTIFQRGVYTDPGAPVQPGTPAVLPLAPAGPPNRLTLARWLVSPENPLTARVTVNRLWAEIFGHGIVTTPEDFGIKGERPTHPELLDWLAVEFMENGWSMKKILRQIVTSATYRQSSRVTPELLARDDRNLLYARGPRQRMDAEMIRDNALSIAGLLSLGKGGPPIHPPQPDGLWKKVGGQNYTYEVSPGEQKYRRGLYVVLKRGSPYPSFVNFDASARMTCVIKRSRSNTPLQALTLLNDPVYVEAALGLARRIVTEQPGTDLDTRLTHAFRLALARTPAAGELAVLRVLHDQQLGRMTGDASAVKALIGSFAPPENVPPAEFAAWYAIACALLNLDETITKG